MSEPTVIERMVRAWREESGKSFLRTGDMTRDEVEHMLILAAVRELKASLDTAEMTRDQRSICHGWMNDVLDEPPSPTDRP